MLSLQAQMLLLLAIGIFLTKKNIITEQGRACLTDLLLTSIYLIPQRIVMWSMGVSYFMRDDAAASPGGRTHHRAVLRKTLTHPCILAAFVGMALMLTQCQLPAFLGKALQCTSNCTALSTVLSLITTPLWCLVV